MAEASNWKCGDDQINIERHPSHMAETSNWKCGEDQIDIGRHPSHMAETSNWKGGDQGILATGDILPTLTRQKLWVSY